MRLITDKKSEQKPLEVPEEIYHTIINDIFDTIVEIDLNGNFTYISPQCFQMFGYNPHEIIGRKALRFIHPDDLLYVMNKVKTAIEDQKHISYEYRTKHKNGGYVHVSAKGGIVKREGITKLIAVVRDITEKKIAEIKLKESEKQFRNIIENTKDAIVIIDFEGKLLYNSPQLSKMLKGREISKNSRFFHYIHKDDVKKLISFYKTTLKDKTFLEKTVEFRILPKHGDYMWFSSSSKNYYDDEENVIGFISTLKDITDKMIAEQKLKDSEQKYRLITENSNDLIRVLNEDFKIEFINERTHHQVLGYTHDDLIGGFDIKLNHPEDYAKIRKFMLRLFKSKEGVHISRMQHKNGNYLWFEVKVKMFKDDQGNQKYLFISRNITERRKSELALMESEEKYRNLYENSPNAVLLTDKHGLTLDMNFNIVTSNQALIIERMYQELLNGNKSKPTEFQIKKKNGNRVWISYQSSMIKLDNEIIIESIVQDITDKKKAENLIIEENKRLLELNKIKSDLISRVSHELKTPITSIVGGAQILLSIVGGAQILLELYKDQTCSDALEFIEMINRGGKRLKILIENLLDASRIESEKLKLNLQKENIVDIVKNCINENRYLASKRNIILELNLPEVVNIEIDKIRIEQVITNLLSNAIKNTPKKGIIRIKLEGKGNSVYFTIKDKGIGLTEKEMEKLFTKFGKIERYGQKMDIDIEGSGLGLFISKEIVDLHGGHIWVESAGRNEGSTFYIKLFKNMNDNYNC
jgi:PAS domain S-box-containing protein